MKLNKRRLVKYGCVVNSLSTNLALNLLSTNERTFKLNFSKLRIPAVKTI